MFEIRDSDWLCDKVASITTGNGLPKFCFAAQFSLRDVKKKESKKEERRENSLMTTALFIAI